MTHEAVVFLLFASSFPSLSFLFFNFLTFPHFQILPVPPRWCHRQAHAPPPPSLLPASARPSRTSSRPFALQATTTNLGTMVPLTALLLLTRRRRYLPPNFCWDSLTTTTMSQPQQLCLQRHPAPPRPRPPCRLPSGTTASPCRFPALGWQANRSPSWWLPPVVVHKRRWFPPTTTNLHQLSCWWTTSWEPTRSSSWPRGCWRWVLR